MSILFTLKGELDQQLYWIQGYRRNNIIDILFQKKGLTGGGFRR